jgi:NAD(P)-dependent dehydrogenase (short-subunit alcohol dehydrogenase family)
MLYHLAICQAARQLDWKVACHRRGEELTQAAEALQASTDEVERFMNDVRRTLTPPWTAEHRSAFAAAIGSLSNQSRLYVPRTGQ